MMNGMRRYHHRGTRLDLPDDVWAKLDKPVVFYSVAYANHARERYYHKDQLRRFMEKRILPSPNVLFSVRNDGTKSWLESVLGYRSDKIIEVPDPALFVPTVDSFHPEVEVDETNVLLALNVESEVYRFGGRWPDRLWRHLPGWKRRKRQFLPSIGLPG